MNKLNLTFTVAILLFMTNSMTSATACASNDDCFFGSTCNEAKGICECSLPCTDFNRELVCTNRQKRPLTRCKAQNLACELQDNVTIISFKFSSFVANRKNCKLVHAAYLDSGEMICKDQSLCSREGGICLERNGQKTCSCNSNFSGSRCDNRIPIISASHDDQPGDFTEVIVVSNQEPEKNIQITNGNSLIIGKVAPYAALAILSCMLCCCFVARHYRRRKPENESEIEIDLKTDKQINTSEKKPQSTKKDTQTNSKYNKPTLNKRLDSRSENIVSNISRKNSLQLAQSKSNLPVIELSTVVQVEINSSSVV